MWLPCVSHSLLLKVINPNLVEYSATLLMRADFNPHMAQSTITPLYCCLVMWLMCHLFHPYRMR